MMGLLLGLSLGISISFVIEYFDNTIKSIDEVDNERRSLMVLMGELNREITSAAQKADCDYQERRLLHHILHNKDYTIESAAASLGLREAEVRNILESLQIRGLTR